MAKQVDEEDILCIRHWKQLRYLQLSAVPGVCSKFLLHLLYIYIHVCSIIACALSLLTGFAPRRWPSGKASASRPEDPGFKSRLRWDFFGVKS